MIPLDTARPVSLDSSCSNRRGYEHERNRQFRFRTVLGGGNTADPRLWIPSKAGNRSLIRLYGLVRGFICSNLSGGKQSALNQNRYRRLAARGHARKLPSHRPTGTENDRALTAGIELRLVRHQFLLAGTRANDLGEGNQGSSQCQHSEPCGFLFLSLLGLAYCRTEADSTGLPMFSLGGFLCFCSFGFVLIHALTSTGT